MSALGQKQTYAAQQPMSALPPIASAKADSRKRSCPLYKRTHAVQQRMSATGQKRTFRERVGTSAKGSKADSGTARQWRCGASSSGRAGRVRPPSSIHFCEDRAARSMSSRDDRKRAKRRYKMHLSIWSDVLKFVH